MINSYPMDTILTLLPAPARLYENILNGIRRRLGAKYELQTIDYDIDEATLKKLLLFWHPLGCIFVGAKGLGMLTHSSFGKIPVVYLDRTPWTKECRLDVLQDYEENGQIAARELIQPEIQDYAFVGNSTPAHWSQIRGRAFADVIRLHGKEYHGFEETDGTGERLRHLEHWLLGLPKPVGVFAANDRTAQEVLTICKRNKIAVPRDLSLLGIDNIPEICEQSDPKISSISSDFEQGGWTCADLLLERLLKPHLRKALRKYPTLGVVVRTSTCKTYGFSGQILRAIKIIRGRACEGLTVDDVAADLGCSRRMAEIRFRQAMGHTIKDAITNVRLGRAKVLLKDRNMPLTRIVASCGYGTENALRIAYKKKFGITLRKAREKTADPNAHRSEGT